MPYLINNSTKCKYWTYSYDQKLLNLINNHHKKLSSKPFKITKHIPCKNKYTIKYDFSKSSHNEYVTKIIHPRNITKLSKKIKNYYGKGHIVEITINSNGNLNGNLNTRGIINTGRNIVHSVSTGTSTASTICNSTTFTENTGACDVVNDSNTVVGAISWTITETFDRNSTKSEIVNKILELYQKGVSITLIVTDVVSFYAVKLNDVKVATFYVNTYVEAYNNIMNECHGIRFDSDPVKLLLFSNSFIVC